MPGGKAVGVFVVVFFIEITIALLIKIESGL